MLRPVRVVLCRGVFHTGVSRVLSTRERNKSAEAGIVDVQSKRMNTNLLANP